MGGKSPLTGSIAKAEVGEHWGAQLKRAGFDALIIEGKAKSPVYLHIQAGKATIRDANHLGKEYERDPGIHPGGIGGQQDQSSHDRPGG